MSTNNYATINDNASFDQIRKDGQAQNNWADWVNDGPEVEPGSNDFNDKYFTLRGFSNWDVPTGITDDQGKNFWGYDETVGGWVKLSSFPAGGLVPQQLTIARPDVSADSNAKRRDLKKQIAKLNKYRF